MIVSLPSLVIVKKVSNGAYPQPSVHVFICQVHYLFTIFFFMDSLGSAFSRSFSARRVFSFSFSFISFLTPGSILLDLLYYGKLLFSFPSSPFCHCSPQTTFNSSLNMYLTIWDNFVSVFKGADQDQEKHVHKNTQETIVRKIRIKN